MWASEETLHAGSVLAPKVQPLVTDSLHSARAKKDPKHSAYEGTMFSVMKETVRLVTDLLHPTVHSAVFCTTQ